MNNKLHPKIYTISAATVGYLLISDLDAWEQNALGNWLMLVAQMLSTNASIQQVQNTRNLSVTNAETIKILQTTVNTIKDEVEKIKKTI